MRRMLGLAILMAAFVAAGAVNAHAQMGGFKSYLTAHVGSTLGGELDNPSAAFGGSLSVHDDTGWGAEFDLGHSADAAADGQILDITSYMVNAIWTKPIGFVRPFGIAGAGVLSVSGCGSCAGSTRTNDFGLGFGGGVLAELNDAFAVRADARYLFSSADHAELGRPDSMNFWRLSFGATFMWWTAP